MAKTAFFYETDCNFMTPRKDITIYDIAEKLKLSSATVSRALNGNSSISKATRKKVQDAAKAMGYQHNSFASSLRKQKTNTIGVMLHELNSNFITSVLAGIENVTNEAGYDIIIAHASEKAEKEIANATNLFHKRVDGLIASLSFNTKNLDHFRQFEEKGIPVIFFDRVMEDSNFSKVIIDNTHNGYQATQHLIEQGCKTIVLVTSDLHRNVYAQRHKGYMNALKENKIPYQKNLVLIKDLSEKAGVDAARQIMEMKPMPDGLFVTNDFVAAVIMYELQKSGIRVPEEIAIVGFNNDTISKLVTPQLSTVDYPGKEMGEIAARTLVNHLKGIANIQQMKTIIIGSEFIIRDSSLRKKT